jgi:hypothetical protein
MIVVDFQHEGRRSAVLVQGWSGPEAHLFLPERDRAQDTTALHDRPFRQPCWWRRKRAKRGCAQCAHPGLRIGSYWCLTGPDRRCLWGSGGCSRAGTRFESHLGHSRSPRERGFCFNV